MEYEVHVNKNNQLKFLANKHRYVSTAYLQTTRLYSPT